MYLTMVDMTNEVGTRIILHLIDMRQRKCF